MEATALIKRAMERREGVHRHFDRRARKARRAMSLLRSVSAALAWACVLLITGCVAGPGLTPDDLPISCLDKPDPGPCRASEVRYYYDYREDRCKPFRYGGCQGYVPFDSMQACLAYCGAKP